MTNRRTFFTAIAAVAASVKSVFGLTPKLPLATDNEILKSFDARDWAKYFVAHVRNNPSIATDEETMTTWFANSLMRGYDERAHWERTHPPVDGADRDLPSDLAVLAHKYDPRIGDLGRGHQFPLWRVIQLKRELVSYGFRPYETPGIRGFNSQFLALYSNFGSPVSGVWFGFVREYKGAHEVVAFELEMQDIKEFVERTGCGSARAAMQAA